MNLKSILIVAGLVIGGAAIAQTGAKTGSGPKGGQQGGQRGPGGPGGQGMRRMSPEQRVERMAKDLGLNAGQKTKILAIYKASSAEGQKIFQDQKMTREQKMKAFEKFRTENTKKIKAVLTPAQVKKFDEIQKQRRMRGPGSPGGAQGGVKAGAGSKAGGGKSGGG